MNTNILQSMDLPSIVKNKRLPLDEQLKRERNAAIARNVHSAMNASVGNGTAKAIIESTHHAVDLRDHYSAMFWAVIAPINNVAVMEVKTAFDLLKKTKYFKQNIKRNAKMTMERIDKYDDAVVRTMRKNVNGDRSQYWMDYTDEHYDSMKHDLYMFYLSVLQVLTRFDEDDREMKARLVTSHALLNYAVGIFDSYFQKVEEQHHVSIEQYFHEARLGYVQSTWCEVVDSICVTDKPMNVNEDKNVNLAFNIIERHILDIDRISDIGKVAIGYNPDVLDNRHYVNPVNTADNFERSFRETVG